MAEQNGDTPHTTAPNLPVGRPFAPGYDARRNAGGRPRGLAAAARSVVGDDGHKLVAFFDAVMRGDSEFVGEKVTLQHRLEAARWLGDRTFGKAPIIVEPPDAPAGPITPEPAQAMPEDLRQRLREWLLARREEWLAQRSAEAEARMLAFMPDGTPDGNRSK